MANADIDRLMVLMDRQSEILRSDNSTWESFQNFASAIHAQRANNKMASNVLERLLADRSRITEDIGRMKGTGLRTAGLDALLKYFQTLAEGDNDLLDSPIQICIKYLKDSSQTFTEEELDVAKQSKIKLSMMKEQHATLREQVNSEFNDLKFKARHAEARSEFLWKKRLLSRVAVLYCAIFAIFVVFGIAGAMQAARTNWKKNAPNQKRRRRR